jgi:type IV pilus assembly protein PilA
MEKFRNVKGFTLIELLVVVAIIGILAAIAIPQFAAYRQRAFDARAESDLRNAATAEEAYFVDNEAYTTNTSSLVGWKQSDGVSTSISTATSQLFVGTSFHSKGTTTFTWNSNAGGLQP